MVCCRSKVIIKDILQSKMKEIELGVDGFMVYDARVVPHVNEVCLTTIFLLSANLIGTTCIRLCLASPLFLLCFARLG